MTEQVTVKLKDGMHLEAFTPAFEAPIPLDADDAVGGQGLGHRPLQMMLVSLGGCMTMDAISILRKKKQDFSDFQVTFQTEHRSDHPKAYTVINMHFTVTGQDVSEAAMARALELSYEKYCPANALLKQAAEVNYTYEVISE